MLRPLQVQLEPVRMVLGHHRVVAADTFDEAPVARAARIRNDDAIEGPLLGAATRQSDLDGHGCSSLLISKSLHVLKPPGRNAESPCLSRPFCPSFDTCFTIRLISWCCFRSLLTS